MYNQLFIKLTLAILAEKLLVYREVLVICQTPIGGYHEKRQNRGCLMHLTTTLFKKYTFGAQQEHK